MSNRIEAARAFAKACPGEWSYQHISPPHRYFSGFFRGHRPGTIYLPHADASVMEHLCFVAQVAEVTGWNLWQIADVLRSATEAKQDASHAALLAGTAALSPPPANEREGR